MSRRKKKKNEEEALSAYFMSALQDHEIPLLTLDARWHDLFPDFRKTNTIKELEKRLNKLIQKQGQVTNDLKEYEKVKKSLLSNIVANMTDGHEPDSAIRFLKQDRNQKLLDQLNKKQQEARLLQEQLPDQIEEANRALLVECMRICYQELVENTEHIEEIEAWIQETREILKQEILKKQGMEMRNTQMYKYMHNLLGADVVNVFDRRHKIWKGNLEENNLID